MTINYHPHLQQNSMSILTFQKSHKLETNNYYRTFLKKNLFVATLHRLVHGLVRVGFVPNLKPTQLLWVYHFWTHHQLVKGFGSDGRTSPETGRFSLGLKSAKWHQILLKATGSCWNPPNSPHMLRSGRISMRSCLILKRSSRTRWDLAGSWRDLAKSQ